MPLMAKRSRSLLVEIKMLITFFEGSGCEILDVDVLSVTHFLRRGDIRNIELRNKIGEFSHFNT